MRQIIFTIVGLLVLIFPQVQSQSWIMSQIVQDENELFRSNTVSLVLTPPTLSSIETTTQVQYGSNLFSTSYQLLTSITSLQQTITSSSNNMIAINTTIKSLRVTGFTITFSSPLIRQTSLLKLSYITVDNLFRLVHFYTYDNYLGDNFPGLVPSMSQSLPFVFNFSSKVSSRSLVNSYSQYKIQTFIKGYEIINNNCQQFSLAIIPTVINSTFYSLKVKSKALTSQQITKVYVTIVVFNSTYILSQNTLYEQFSVQFSPSVMEYSSFGMYKINLSNFFVGVQQFTFTNPTNSFQFDIQNDFINQKSILTNLSPSLSTLTVLMIKVQRRSCTNPNYSYFLYNVYRCYDKCPVRYWQDETLKKCQICLYDCYQCVNSSSCTKCNSTYYFRQDNITNDILRCKPIAGYYSSKLNQIIALRCDITKCVQCSLLNDNCTRCKQNQYLDVINYVGSCHLCMQHCLECDDGVTCNKCQQMYQLSSTRQCVPKCSKYCSQCQIQTLPMLTTICNKCLTGYYINSSSLTSQCYSICGDGLLAFLQQQCDDNNMINGDGCSSQCKEQLGYNCYVVNNSIVPLPQLCYYQQQIEFTLTQLIKHINNKNQFMFNLTISTINTNVLKQLQYEKIITIDMEYIQFSVVSQEVYYKDQMNSSEVENVVVSFIVWYTERVRNEVVVVLDPKKSLGDNNNNNVRLLIELQQQQQSQQLTQQQQYTKLYQNSHHQSPHHNHNHHTKPLLSTTTTTNTIPTTTINNNPTISSTSPPTSTNPTKKFTTTPSTKHTILLKSNNNIAIIYQSQSIFTIATITQYLFIVIAILALIMLLCSMTIYGGKVIALQFLLLSNCVYFSLVEFGNIQVFSTLRAVGGLRVVALNLLVPITYTTMSNNNNNNSQLWWMGINNNLINNCIIPICILSIPLIISTISFTIYKRTSSTQTLKKAQFLYKYSLGELLMTCYLLGGYTFTINLIISIKQKITSQFISFDNEVINITIGLLLFVIGMMLFILLIKKKEYYWEFINTFYRSSLTQYYMNFTTLIVWVNSIGLVVMSDLLYGNLVPIVMSILWMGFLLKLNPYRNGNQRRRPIIIQIVSILVQSILLLLKIKLTQNNQMYQLSIIYHYLPLCIAIMLLFTLIYSAYCLYQKIKQAYIDRQQYLQNENLVKNNITLLTYTKHIQSPTNYNNNYNNNNINNDNDDDNLSSQKNHNNLTIQKQIILQLKKQRNFNFLSLALSIDKKQLDQNWQQLQKVTTKRNSDMINLNNNKNIVRQSIKLGRMRKLATDNNDKSISDNSNSRNNNRQMIRFIQDDKLKDYFKLNVQRYDQQVVNDVVINNNNSSNNNSISNSDINPTYNKINKHPTHNNIHPPPPSPQHLISPLQQSPSSNQHQQQSQIQQYVNCGQKQTIKNENYYQYQLIQQQKLFSSQKYKQQWRQFIKPKSIIQKDKLHSLIQYDMI